MSKDEFSHSITKDFIPVISTGEKGEYDGLENNVKFSSSESLNYNELIKNITDIRIKVNPKQIEILESEKIQLANKEHGVFFKLIKSDDDEGEDTYLYTTKKFAEWIKTENILELSKLAKKINSLRTTKIWWDIDDDGELTDEKDGIKTMAIEILKQATEIPEAELAEQVVNHELSHYVDMSSKNSGAFNLLIQMLEDFVNHYYYDAGTEDNTLHPLIFELMFLMRKQSYIDEASAMAHELFGFIVDENHSEYNFSLFSMRIVVFLQLFTSETYVSYSGTKIVRALMGEFEQEEFNHEFDEHDVGTLIMLFGNQIISPNGIVDLNTLLANDQRRKKAKKKARLVMPIIIDRIKFVIANPEKFREEFIDNDVYSFITNAQDNLNKHIFKFIMDNGGKEICNIFKDKTENGLKKAALMEQIFGEDE